MASSSVDSAQQQRQQQQHQDLQEPLLLPSSNDHEERQAAATADVVDDDTVEGGGSSNRTSASVKKPSLRNIRLTLWYMLFRCGGEAIWYYSVLSSYVYLIQPNHPALVGYLSAIEGMVQFVAALVTGFVADHFYNNTPGKRRSVLLKLSSIIGVLACTMTLVASGAWQDDNNDSNDNDKSSGGGGLVHVLCLALAMVLWGIFDGISLTVSMALFADSMQQGDRSYYFTQRTTCTTLGSVFGPLCGIIMFYILGDTWTVADCAMVIRMAQVFLIPAFIMLCFFRDTDIIIPADNDETAAVDRSATTSTPMILEHEQQCNNGTACTTIRQPLLLQEEQHAMQQDVEEQPPVTTTTTSNDTALPYCCCCFSSLQMSKSRYIAILAAGSDILCAFASGICFRYFTIFFVTHLHLDPVLVQGMDAISCLAGIAVLQITQKVSLRFGRCATAVIFKWTGVIWLLTMTIGYQHGYIRQWWLVAILYQCQNAFLSSTGALTRSLVMDNVPSEERAKWSALESINIFGWCGTAAVGGYLVEHFHGNVLPVFYISAMLQVVGSLPLVMLIQVETLERE